MHSIAKPSMSAFSTISSLSPAQPHVARFCRWPHCPDATISKIPYCFVDCSSSISQPFAAQGVSKVSMWPISLIALTCAVRTWKVSNVSSSCRHFTLAALFSCRRPSSPPASPVFFSKQIPSAFRSVQGAFYPGSCHCFSVLLGATLSPRLGFSTVNTSAYLRVTSEHFYSPLFGSHVFRGGGVPIARLPRKTI